jgi:hypothetical protein
MRVTVVRDTIIGQTHWYACMSIAISEIYSWGFRAHGHKLTRDLIREEDRSGDWLGQWSVASPLSSTGVSKEVHSRRTSRHTGIVAFIAPVSR